MVTPMEPWIFIAGFVPLFLLVWFGSMFLIARVGGWRDLARVYREETPMEFARQWRNKYGKMRYATGYNGCLNIAASAMGMRLWLWTMFRPAHPPLFIPWSDISTAVEQGIFVEMVRFSFQRVPGATLVLRRKLAEEILRAVPGVTSAAWLLSPRAGER
jgi:hypothetical protein